MSIVKQSEDEIKVKISDPRLNTLICLALIIEKKEISIKYIINETPIQFKNALQSMNSLVKLRLIETLFTNSNFPNFKLINELEARKYYLELKHQPENNGLPRPVI